MKPLIAISSWHVSALNGDHQVLRDTWLRDCACDYCFFLGDGTPAPANPELDAAWDGRLAHYGNHAGESYLLDYQPQSDEVMLPVPWDFKHLALKVREMFRWALAHDYAPVFKVDTDTYVDIPRLLASGFEQHDYVGYPFARDGWSQASGGAGYGVSARAMLAVIEQPVNIAYEDTWVGQTLRAAGILLHQDHRFRVCWPHDHREGPRPDNDSITAHLGFSPEPFDNREMLDAHRQRMEGV